MRVVLYTNNCPQCKILKTKLDEKNIKYEVFDNIDMMLEKGFRSMPILEIDDTTLIFPKALEWVKGV
ncbi:MAG: glutaredoxin domain-containing protein [Paludibacteraceae bacterium]